MSEVNHHPLEIYFVSEKLDIYVKGEMDGVPKKLCN